MARGKVSFTGRVGRRFHPYRRRYLEWNVLNDWEVSDFLL